MAEITPGATRLKPDGRPMRRFYLTQRIHRGRLTETTPSERTGIQKLGRNPFGYGNLGDYDLDYMGSAEFEWGAIPEALKRLAKTGWGITYAERNYRGHALDFLWITKEGDPFEDWCAWAEGKPRTDRYGYSCQRRPFEGKESVYDLAQRLAGREPDEYGWRTDIWWALTENVMWSFAGEGHIEAMLTSMQKTASEVRG
jgi:hypothetical protein